jgi:hypothetical protein
MRCCVRVRVRPNFVAGIRKGNRARTTKIGLDLILSSSSLFKLSSNAGLRLVLNYLVTGRRATAYNSDAEQTRAEFLGGNHDAFS